MPHPDRVVLTTIEAADSAQRKAWMCRDVLDDLPEWFGIPEATRTYVEQMSTLPVFVLHDDEHPVGILGLKPHSPFATEIHVLAIKRRYHRRGLGTRLVEAAAERMAKQGALFLTVKTVAPSRPDPAYAATRRFYEAMGFLPLEVFPTLWGSANPCLMLIKPLRQVAVAG